MAGFHEARDKLIKKYYQFLEKLLKPLVNEGVSPDMVTTISFIFSLIAAGFYAVGLVFLGGIMVLTSGFVDTMDGTIARMTGKASKSGALLDSSMDRLSEFFIFFGLLVHYRNVWIFYVVMIALMGSIMVSYVKARAEALGKIRVVGLMQRPERVILLAGGSLLNGIMGKAYPECPDCGLAGALLLLALLTNITVIQRLRAGKKDLKKSE